jgi:hypothetical protein
MTRRLAVFAMFATTICSSFSGAQAVPVDDRHGKEWRQLTDSVGVSWNQVSEICPRDGISACSGAIDELDFTGWVWATDAQVIELFSYYTPDILKSTMVTGPEYFFAGSLFLTELRPTETIFITYFGFEMAAGWTASTDYSTLPVAGAVSFEIGASVGGTFNVVPSGSPDMADSTVGVFLFRPTGFGTSAIIANDDLGRVASPAGGTAVANVLGNDWFAGAPATTASVTLSQDSSTSAGILLDPENGSVQVASGTADGTHVLVYRICEKADPANCATANARIIVPAYAIDAENDGGSVSPSTGGVPITNVLTNDMLAGTAATTANVILSQVSSTSAGVALDLASGSVVVAKDTPFGDHSLVYQICEAANPSNCAQARATITVVANQVVAANDSVRVSSKAAGRAIADVLANDWLGDAPATTANVSLSLLSVAPANRDIRLDPATGSVDILRRTQSGTYALVYRICETAAPDNCADGTASLTLSGK